MYLKKQLTILLALLLLLQCAAPVSAAYVSPDAEEVLSAEPVDDVIPEPAEEDAPSNTESPVEEMTAEPCEEAEPAVPELPTAAEEEPAQELTEQEEPAQESTEPEWVTEGPEDEGPEGITEAREERLYNGLPADYDDPQFVKLLEQGFFDEPEGPVQAKARYQHNPRFKGYVITKGVDVSKWNHIVDWKKAKQDGIQFAIIRCGNRFSNDGRLGADELFDRNMRGATGAGMDVGVYFFSQAINEKEAIAEARYTLKLVKGYTFTLPIVFDFEYYGNGRLSRARLTKEQRTRICKAFCKTIEDAGYPAMVYANRNMLTEDMYGEELPKAGYEVWLAEWNNAAKYEGTYTYWQYSDNGHVKGFDHQVDVNFRYRLPDTSFTGLVCNSMGIRLSWKKVAPAQGYRIYRKGPKGKWKLLKTIGSPSTLTFTDSSIKAGVTYTYSIQTFDGLVEGAFDSVGRQISFHRMEGLTSAVATAEGIRVKWKKNADFDEYRVLRKRNETDPWQTIASVNGNQNSYLDKRRFPSGSTWYYTVMGVKNGVTGQYDKNGLAVKWLSAPVLLDTSSGPDGITVQWNKVKGADAYKVFRKTETEKWTSLGVVTETSYCDATAEADTIYTYTVRAVSGEDQSAYDSNGVEGKRIATPKLSFTSSRNNGTEMAVVWKSVSGAYAYRVYRRGSAEESWKSIGTSRQTFFVDTTVQKGKPYFYTVRAYGKFAGKTITSGVQPDGIAAKWLDMPVLNPKQVSKSGVRVSWKRVKDATGFIVYRKTGKTGWKKLAKVENAQFYLDRNPVKGVVCTYTVCSVFGKHQSGYDPVGVSALVLSAPTLRQPTMTRNGVRLSWTSVSGAQSYCIYRKTENDSSWILAGTSKKTTYLDTDDLGSGKCWYKVKAFATLDDEEVYSPASGFKGLLVLGKPFITEAIWTEEGIQLKWQAVDKATGYRIFRKNPGGDWKLIGTVGTVTSYLDSTANPKNRYLYILQAVRGNVEGPFPALPVDVEPSPMLAG